MRTYITYIAIIPFPLRARTVVVFALTVTSLYIIDKYNIYTRGKRSRSAIHVRIIIINGTRRKAKPQSATEPTESTTL